MPLTEIVVKPGDTLSQLALRHLGSAFRWPELWRWNRDRIKNPHLIYPGQTIRILNQ